MTPDQTTGPPRPPDGTDPSLPSKLAGNRFAVGCLVAAGVLVAAMVIGVVAIGSIADRLNPFRDPLVVEKTIERSGPPVLKTLTDLGDYQAATAYYELVIDVEKDVQPLPSFLAGERVLFVAAGNVDASVDFTALDAGAVVVSPDRTSATITLPAPTLSKPRLDNSRSYIYSRDRGLIDRVGDALGNGSSEGADTQGLYLTAEQRLAEAAADNNDLRDKAEENTRQFLTGLLTSLGYTDVTVVFEPAPTVTPSGQ